MGFIAVVFFVWENRKLSRASSASEKRIKEGEKKKEEILDKARQESNEIVSQAKKESYELTQKAEKMEERILEREEKIEKKLEHIEKKQDDLIAREENLKKTQAKLDEKSEELDGKLAELSKLSEKEARNLFLEQIAEKYEKDGITQIEKYKKKVEEQKKESAREIVLRSIQQYAGDITSEVTTTVIEIPSDDIKGKLIGKE